MHVSNLRGSEGSGIVTAHRDNKIGSYKILGNGIDLMNSKGFGDLMNGGHATAPSTIIGHTRAPTKGGRDRDAVHPHDGGRVIGVHNGTLFRVNSKTIPQDKSDSKAAYVDIGERGLDAFVQDVEGAYCLVYADKETQTLNFIRNAQRPLWFAKCGTGIKKNADQKPVTIFWSSEKIFLQFALMRENYGDSDYVLEDLPINTLVSYPLIAKGPLEPTEVRQIAKVYPTHTTRWTTGTGGAKHTQVVPYVSSTTPTVPTTTSAVMDARSGGRTNDKHVTRWVRYYGKDPNELVLDIVKVRDFPGSTLVLYRCTWSNGSITETEGFPAAKYATGLMQEMFKRGVIDRKDIVPFDFNKAKAAGRVIRAGGGPGSTLSLPLTEDEVPFSKEDEVSKQEEMENLFVSAYSSANVHPGQRLSKAEKRAQRRTLRLLAKANRRKTMAALHDHMAKQSLMELPDPEEKNDACAVPLLDDEIDPIEDTEEITLHETIKDHYVDGVEFHRITQNNGCSWCTNASYKNDHRNWFSRDEFLCDDCHKDAYCRQYLGIVTDDDLDKRSVH